jgi:hypothetical protein
MNDTTTHKTDLIQAAQHLCIHHSLDYSLLEHIYLQNIRKSQVKPSFHKKGKTSTPDNQTIKLCMYHTVSAPAIYLSNPSLVEQSNCELDLLAG